MKSNHNLFFNLALKLAEINLGRTKINPSVGCIIVKNDSVISSGLTSANGRPHAEFNALNKNLNFRGSVMYVTLEPCTHYGLTPPCINIIKKKKVKKVYYIYDDPDIRTFKKAKAKLKKKIIKFKRVNFQNDDFYKSYYLNKQKKLPLLDAKIAISKDYYTISNRNKWITNEKSRRVGHLIRSKYDSIISTSNSINKDDSLLNCRINGFDNFKPDLIIVDRYLNLKKKLRLFDICKKRNTYIFTTSNNTKKISFFKKKKIKIIKLDKLDNINDFKVFLNKLFQIGKRRILVESGLTFLNELFRFRLINQLFIFKSDKILKKKGHNNSSIYYVRKQKLNNQVKVNLNNDKLFKTRFV